MEIPYTSIIKRIARRLSGQRITAARKNFVGEWLILNEDQSVAQHIDGVHQLDAYARHLGVLGADDCIAPLHTASRGLQRNNEASELAVVVDNLLDGVDDASREEILSLLARVAPRTRPMLRRILRAA
jgi:hypothetical protein